MKINQELYDAHSKLLSELKKDIKNLINEKQTNLLIELAKNNDIFNKEEKKNDIK